MYHLTVAKITEDMTINIVTSLKTKDIFKKPFSLAKITSLIIRKRRLKKAAAFKNPRGKRTTRADISERITAKLKPKALIFFPVTKSVTPENSRNI